MAWSAPMTAVAGATFSAAQFNQYVRDNLNETAPAKATAAGQIFVSTGVNAIAARTPSSATVATAETTTSTSYANLATVGPTVTVTTGTSALVAIRSGMENATSNVFTAMSFAVSGASSQAAANATAVEINGITAANRVRIGAMFHVTGLTAGSNTFQAKYTVASSTGTFVERHLIVVPL